MAYETIVIGAGVIGSAIALRLAQAGQKPPVLQKSTPDAAASPALAAELRELSGVDVGFERCGLLSVAMEGEDLGPWETRLAWQREAGLEVERLSGREVRELEPELSDRVTLALLFAREGRVD